MVDADSVGAKILHQLGIPGTLLSVKKRIVGNQLVRNAPDEELLTITGEELVADSLDCRNRVSDSRTAKDSEKREAHRICTEAVAQLNDTTQEFVERMDSFEAG